MTPEVPTQELAALRARAEDGPPPPEALARQRRERMDEVASYVQTALGALAVVVGLALSTVLVMRGPSTVGSLLVGGIFLVGVLVAVPPARPWLIRVIERMPGARDLPDDGDSV